MTSSFESYRVSVNIIKRGFIFVISSGETRKSTKFCENKYPHLKNRNPRKSLRVNTSLILSVSFFSPFSVGYTLYPRFPIPSTFCGVFCYDFSIPVYTFPGLIIHKTSIIHYLPRYLNTVGVVLGQDSVGLFLRLNS